MRLFPLLVGLGFFVLAAVAFLHGGVGNAGVTVLALIGASAVAGWVRAEQRRRS